MLYLYVVGTAGAVRVGILYEVFVTSWDLNFLFTIVVSGRQFNM